MKLSSRVRIWFWIIAVPLVVAVFLTLALREAARNAEGRPHQSELDRAHAEAVAEAQAREAAEREAREQKQVDDARDCGRWVRPMLNRPEAGPLLMVLTRTACADGCERLRHANLLMEDYALRGLGGVWITLQDHAREETPEDPAPAMARVVVSQCSVLLGHRDEFWTLLDPQGNPLAMPAYHRAADASLPEELEAMRRAARLAVYGR